ncbi:type IV conjugative transfer system protein TraL [Candidatus Paracaedibacter symbiosus]
MAGQGALKHLMYWYLPHNKAKLPLTPPSHIREWVS